MEEKERMETGKFINQSEKMKDRERKNSRKNSMYNFPLQARVLSVIMRKVSKMKREDHS